MLTPRLLQRVRSAVLPPSSVSVRKCTADLVDALRRSWPDVALLDPTLVSEPGRLVWPLREAHVGTVLYVYLRREYLVAAVRLAEYLAVRVVTYGYNDAPSALKCALDCRSRSARGEVLLQSLVARLSELPPVTEGGIHAANQREADFYSVRQLTSYCSVSRNVLTLQLHRAGIRSTHSLLTALQLARRYEVISDDRVSLNSAALLVGVSCGRVLNRQCRAVSGLGIAEVRRGCSLKHFCDCIVRQITMSRHGAKPVC